MALFAVIVTGTEPGRPVVLWNLGIGIAYVGSITGAFYRREEL